MTRYPPRIPRYDSALRATARNLCLHYVSAREGQLRLGLSGDQLRALIVRERSEGRAPASLEQYAGRDAPGPDRFTISFDDAHRSVLDRAAPILRELEIPATIFVPTAWIGTSDEWMDWDDLRALRDLGWTIGAHSVSHPRMSWIERGETEDTHARRLRDECERSREAIGRELGLDVSLFAYPYGEDPPAGREAVRAAGFRAAFTVRASSEWDFDPLSIPRLEALEAAGLVRLSSEEPIGISVVVPARDRAPILREVLARLAAQSYPRDRHEVIVVDDGSRDDLASVLPLDPRFRLTSSGDASARFRAGQARAHGASLARFDHLAFLDADVVVGRDYLWSLDWIHRRWDRATILGYLSGYNLHDLGAIHTLDEVRGRERIEDVPVILDRQREPAARACLDNIEWLSEPWKLCYTGNLSLPRALFDEVGGFSDAFRGWGLEDVDLGYRLHRGGARFVFSRFAIGYHLVDPSEEAPRNPFRRARPTREDFAGYLVNLETLAAHHRGDPAIETYRARTLADIEEICSRPHTVGIELGGAASVRPPFHAALHRMQPGGTPLLELLDRVEYAAKVGARRLWLQGGEPAEHPGFLRVLAAAKEHGLKVGMLTTGHAFADPALAREAHRLGLDHATVLVIGGDAERHEHHLGRGTWMRFALGMESLRDAGIHRSARLVITPGDEEALGLCGERLKNAGIEIDQVLDLTASA